MNRLERCFLSSGIILKSPYFQRVNFFHLLYFNLSRQYMIIQVAICMTCIFYVCTYIYIYIYIYIHIYIIYIYIYLCVCVFGEIIYYRFFKLMLFRDETVKELVRLRHLLHSPSRFCITLGEQDPLRNWSRFPWCGVAT